MSLVFRRAEVAAGPSVRLEARATSPAAVASIPVYLLVAGEECCRMPTGSGTERATVPTVGMNGSVVVGAGKTGRRAVAVAADQEASAAEPWESSPVGAGECSASSSSSTTADEQGEDAEEEVQSEPKTGALGSLESLEESLPVKRGLSNCFAGKSKSFASLSEAVAALGSAKDLAKVENPFNKRRRILAAWQRRAASYAALNSTSSHHLWALQEDQESVGGGGGGVKRGGDQVAGDSVVKKYLVNIV